VELRRYSLTHRHFETGELPPLLRRIASPGVIADLGCGDGTVLAALEQRRLVKASFAVDLSPERVAAAQRAVPSTTGIVASASSTGLPEASVDGVVCSQVIEHMPADRELAPEIARILRPGGWWYVGSVVRRRYAWWVYKVDGVRRLDPTHVREYESPGQLLAVLAHPQLRATQTRVGLLPFPLTDLVMRALARAGVLSDARAAAIYREHPALLRLRKLPLFPPGFRLVEVAGTRGIS
jgi:SAM-dependent methyltransferase